MRGRRCVIGQRLVFGEAFEVLYVTWVLALPPEGADGPLMIVKARGQHGLEEFAEVPLLIFDFGLEEREHKIANV